METIRPLFTAESIAQTRLAVVAQAAQAASGYIASVDSRSVAPTAEAVTALAELGGPLPKTGAQPEEVLGLLHRFGSPATVATSGGRYFGFVIGGTVPAALGAAMLVTAWDQNAAMQSQSPVAAQLEETALAWVVDLLGLPEGSGGGLVTGATMANFCGLAAARHAILERAGWDVEQDGLFAAPPITVVIG